MRGLRSVPLMLLLFAGFPAPTVAQSDVCRLLPGAREWTRIVGADGRPTSFISGPARFRCSDGTVLESDSAVHMEGRGTLELIGNVVYQDSVTRLTAGWVNYLTRAKQLYARDSVELTDRRTGSVIRGPRLEHRPRTAPAPTRAATDTATVPRMVPRFRQPVARPGSGDAEAAPDAPGPALRPSLGSGALTIVDGGGARATFVPESDGDASEADSVGPPLEVDAERIEIRERNSFHARGDVQLRRGTLRGFGREATFEQSEGRLTLVHEARVEDEAYQLLGERIEAVLVEDVLDEVSAEGDAILLADELRVDAARLRIFFEEDALHRLVALGPAPAAGEAAPAADARGDPSTLDLAAARNAEAGPASDSAYAASDSAQPASDSAQPASDSAQPAADSTQPRVRAQDVLLTADSIHALAPGQQLREVTAVGRAYGERAGDARRSELPESVSRDWMRGDTIVGYFVPDSAAAVDPVAVGDTVTAEVAAEREPPSDTAAVPAAAADDDPPAVRLDRLVAIGGEDMARSLYVLWDDATQERPDINYVIARRISLSFRDGEVADLEADGPIRGILLQPGSDPGERADEPDASAPDGGGS